MHHSNTTLVKVKFKYGTDYTAAYKFKYNTC